MAEKVYQLDKMNSSEAVIVVTAAELTALVEKCVQEKIARNELCNGSCGTTQPECGLDTRLSLQRKVNLTRQTTDLYVFKVDLPLAPGEVKNWTVPKYPVGRVIENLFFRPTMADGGNVDDIQVEIFGDDGVRWAIFSGGRHNHQTGCCLLEFFRNDCIGYDETFTFRLTHLGSPGDPNMVRATADWNYLFEDCTDRNGWSWPKRCR